MPQDKLGMLDASYTSETKKLSERENPHLLKYIDEQLGNKKKDPNQDKSKGNTEVTALYVFGVRAVVVLWVVCVSRFAELIFFYLSMQL